jgi:hypothetical protein
MATTASRVRLISEFPFRIFQSDLSGITAEDSVTLTLIDDLGTTQSFGTMFRPVVVGCFTTAPPVDGSGGILNPILTAFDGSAGTVTFTLNAGGKSDGSAAAALFTDAIFWELTNDCTYF